MSRDMKLIMENWRGFITEDDGWQDCDTSKIPVQMYLTAYYISGEIKDQEAAYAKAASFMKKLNKKEATRDQLDQTLQVSTLIAGVMGSNPALGVFSGAAMFVATLFKNSKEKKFREASGNVRNLLQMFCIDGATLDLINDEMEVEYIQNSGVLQEIENFLKQASKDPSVELPNLTHHLVNWINTETSYSKSPETDLIER